MVPQRDWNCTECLRRTWHTGQGWQGALQVSGAAESRSTTGSTAQHQGWQCCEQWCLCSAAGEGVPVWDPTQVGSRMLFPAVASGLFSGFPWNKLKTTSVPLFVPFRTIWNLFFHPELPKNTMQGRLREQGFRLFLLLYYDWYTILSQFMVYSCWSDTLLYCKIITTIALSDNWIMSHNYLFCVCGENLELLS